MSEFTPREVDEDIPYEEMSYDQLMEERMYVEEDLADICTQLSIADDYKASGEHITPERRHWYNKAKAARKYKRLDLQAINNQIALRRKEHKTGLRREFQANFYQLCKERLDPETFKIIDREAIKRTDYVRLQEAS